MIYVWATLCGFGGSWLALLTAVWAAKLAAPRVLPALMKKAMTAPSGSSPFAAAARARAEAHKHPGAP